MGEEQNKRQDKMNINNRPNTNNFVKLQILAVKMNFVSDRNRVGLRDWEGNCMVRYD